jgi:hypothetical protein
VSEADIDLEPLWRLQEQGGRYGGLTLEEWLAFSPETRAWLKRESERSKISWPSSSPSRRGGVAIVFSNCTLGNPYAEDARIITAKAMLTAQMDDEEEEG